MTGEEMERAIEFVLQKQATLEEYIKQSNERIEQSNERIEQVNRDLSEQIAETNRVVQMMGVTQSQFNEMMTKLIVTLVESQQKLADSLQHTDRKLDALIDIVRERLEGKEGDASS